MIIGKIENNFSSSLGIKRNHFGREDKFRHERVENFVNFRNFQEHFCLTLSLGFTSRESEAFSKEIILENLFPWKFRSQSIF